MSSIGYIQVRAYTSYARLPLKDVAVTVTSPDGTAIAMRLTDRNGKILPIEVPVPDKKESQQPEPGEKPFTNVNLYARLAGFEQVDAEDLQVFADTITVQDLEMVPLSELPNQFDQSVRYRTAAKSLGGDSLPPVSPIPYIPQRITVHLGPPDASAANVTVSFVDYVKNVASSEIYPTWEESALRANILAIVSFALNRVYTEFYRSRGYDFDITSSTAYDQFFVNGRSFFENVSRLVDELFNDYIRRQGFVEPLAAKFCNGTTVTCEGLSQWGSQNLARQGYSSTQILRSYYGNIEIVNNAPVQNVSTSYPGRPIRRGFTGPSVVVIQTELNRISQNYPAIPKISTVDGIFGAQTEAAVRKFQEVFGLTVDGVVGQATWYALVRLYTAVVGLGELRSQGVRYYAISWANSNPIQMGDRGIKVEHLQYMLSVLSAYISEIPPVTIDGVFGSATRSAVLAAQRRFGLPQTGVVNFDTWNEIYDQFSGIENTSFRNPEEFPYTSAVLGNTVPRARYSQTGTMTQFPGNNLSSGNQDPVRQEVVR